MCVSTLSHFPSGRPTDLARLRCADAGVELVGQAFLYRFDEAERVYFWPGITQKDIVRRLLLAHSSAFALR